MIGNDLTLPSWPRRFHDAGRLHCMTLCYSIDAVFACQDTLRVILHDNPELQDIKQQDTVPERSMHDPISPKPSFYRDRTWMVATIPANKRPWVSGLVKTQNPSKESIKLYYNLLNVPNQSPEGLNRGKPLAVDAECRVPRTVHAEIWDGIPTIRKSANAKWEQQSSGCRVSSR